MRPFHNVSPKMTFSRTLVLMLVFDLLSHVESEILYTISEYAEPGAVIGNVLSQSNLKTRYNSSVINRLQYTLMSRGSLPTDYFTIDNKTSQLKVARSIDRDNLCDLLMICCDFEKSCKIPLSIVVQPTRGSFFLQTVKVSIEIRDENDCEPKFQSRTMKGHISEIADIGAAVRFTGNSNPLLANDPDEKHNSVNRYSIISPTETFGIEVSEEMGIITRVSIVSQKELDREKESLYKVVVVAHDGGNPSRSGSVTVEISVDDFNDCEPKFTNSTYTVWLDETAPLDTSVVKVEAHDDDYGLNADINYSIANRPNDVVSRLFTINSVTGEIRTKGRLNFEQKSSYRIMVDATDEGMVIQRQGRTTVIVNLRDVNDHGPQIKAGYLTKADRAEVIESAEIGTFVIFFIATDPDNDEVNCYIDSPMFRLRRSSTDPSEFHLVTAHKLNRELSDRYEVTLTCTDQGQPQLKTAESFTVHILDSNDNSPEFTQNMYTASVTENNGVDVFLLEVKAHDLDTGENARIIYSLNEEGEEQFTINSASGRIYTKQVFDREKSDHARFRVIARDNGTEPLYAEASVIVSIEDENDNAPTFHNPSKFEISEAAGAGVMLGHISATDPDRGPNAQITFDLRRNYDARSFDISNTGVIRTMVPLDRETQSKYHLVVIARDQGDEVVHSSSTTVTIVVTDVNDNPPTIHFPNTYNNTLYISYTEPTGRTLAYVNATDIDLGRNALMEYEFTHGNEQNIFKLDKNTGAIQLGRRLKKKDAIVYKLSVRVMDRAEPYHANVNLLNIVIDGSGKAISLDGRYLDRIASNRDLIIVICLAAVSVILAIILVVAIICIRRTGRDRHLYNVQTENRKLPDNQHVPSSPFYDKEPKYQAPIRRDVNFSTEVEDTYNHVNGHQSPVYSSLRAPPSKSSVYPKSLGIGTKV